MGVTIRSFNDKGIEQFKDNLAQMRAGTRTELEAGLLDSDEFSDEVTGSVEVEAKTFDSKKEMIQYISERVANIPDDNKFYIQGIWTWLSAFYFDSVCPKKDGKRSPKANDRHILNPEHWGRYYRHLIAAPVRILVELGELADIYLTGKPNSHGDLFEQLASRQEMATNPGIIEAATILYWNPKKGTIKRGARSKEGPGIIRRFTRDIIPQYQMTYDLNSMSGQEIVELLPEEFNSWKE